MKTGLIIEDIEETRDWLTSVLKQAFPQLEVTCAATIAEGLAAIEQHCHDIALVDLGLPDGSGIECLLARSSRCPDALSVVSTSFEDDQNLFLSLQAGASGYLLKDQPAAEIVELLKGVVQGLPPLSPTVAQRMMSHFVNSFHPAVDTMAEALTPTERTVLGHIAQGMSVPETAELLGRTRNTVSSHLKNIYSKLNVSSRAEVTRLAIEMGLVD